jgi:ankyrin repeat protein
VATTDYGYMSLYAAAENVNGELIRVLLAGGVDASKATINGCTPLFAAAQNGHLESVRQLLEARADANNSMTDFARTPLYAAAENGHVEVMQKMGMWR